MDTVLLYSIESFPPLRESIAKINELCSKEEIDRKALSQVIEADPILYTNILHFSNAPQHGFKHQIITIAQALSLFGIHTIRGMALTAALKAHPFTDVSPYRISIDEWFKVMKKQQRFLELWLSVDHKPMLQSLGGLTFILEIGRLVASYVLMFTDNPYTFTKTNTHELLLEEKNIIGEHGDELAAKLFELWYFDNTLIDSLRHSLSPDYGVNPQVCAALGCARRLFTLYGIEPFESIEIFLNASGFNPIHAKSAYDTLMKE
jgi:HD-like signal output (HDOD) protein